MDNSSVRRVQEPRRRHHKPRRRDSHRRHASTLMVWRRPRRLHQLQRRRHWPRRLMSRIARRRDQPLRFRTQLSPGSVRSSSDCKGANRGRGRGGRGGGRGGGNGGGPQQSTSTGQPASQPSAMQSPRFRCFNCQEPGHSIAECPHPRDERRISANMEAARLRREQRNQAQAGTGGLPPPYTPHQTLSQPPAYQPYGYIQYSYPPPQMQQMATQPQPPPQQQAAAAAAPAQASGNAGAPARP